MANLTINSLFLITVFLIVLGLLLLSHPFLTLTAITLCAICHALFYNNIPSLVRLQSSICSKIWVENNDHPAAINATVFDGTDMPSPIPHFTVGQDIVRNRKHVSDEIISSTPQSSPRGHQIDKSLLPRSHTPPLPEGRQLSFSRISPKPTRLLTQEEFKGNMDICAHPKMQNRVGGVKTVQTVAGPLLASTRLNNNFDAGMYVNVNSPGFTERLIRCANDNVNLNWSHGNFDTHQEKYNSVGLFPIVHLNSAPAPSLSIRNSIKAPRSSVRVRIAPPIQTDQRLYNGLSANSIPANIPTLRESVRQDDMSKSVLESLQEASRKRIYSQCQEAMEDDAGKKRPRKGDSGFPNPNCDLYQYRHIFRAPALHSNVGCSQPFDTLVQGKRGREDAAPASGDSKRHRQSNKPCTSRNEISSSLSSSQKLLQRLNGNKRKAENDWSRPGTPSHGKHFKDDPVLEPCLHPPWCTLNQEETVTHLKEIIRPGNVEFEANETAEFCERLPIEAQLKKDTVNMKSTKDKIGVKASPSTYVATRENFTNTEALSPSDISSKLFRKEVSCRPPSQRDESKRGRSWAQEPPEADERCLSQQRGSSDLDRPERFQSLLSRMCKQGTNGAKQREGSEYPGPFAAVEQSVSISKNPTDVSLSQMSSETGNRPPPPLPSAILNAPTSLSYLVADGRMEKQTLPVVTLSSEVNGNISLGSFCKLTKEDSQPLTPTALSSIVSNISHSSMGTAVSVSNHDNTSNIGVSFPSTSASSNQQPLKQGFSNAPAFNVTQNINLPSSSEGMQVRTNTEKANNDKSLDPPTLPLTARPVFSLKPTINASDESSKANDLRNSQSGGAISSDRCLGDNSSSGNFPTLSFSSVSSLPVASGAGSHSFSLSKGISEKTDQRQLFSSGSALSQHDFKTSSISSVSFGTPTSSVAIPKFETREARVPTFNHPDLKTSGTVLPSVKTTTSTAAILKFDGSGTQFLSMTNRNPTGVSQMNSGHCVVKPDSGIGILNSVSPSLTTNTVSTIGSSISEGGAIFGITTPSLLSPSSTTFTFSPSSSKTISSVVDKTTFQSSPFRGGSSNASSLNIPTTQCTFNAFDSTANSPTTSAPLFGSSAAPHQSPGLFSFGSSSSQPPTNVLTSSQSSGPSFGGSHPQGFPLFASSGSSAFGTGTTAPATFSPLSDVSFGTPQPALPTVFSAQSGPSSGTFGASSPFGSSTVQSSSSNFNVPLPSSFSVTTPTPAGFGTASPSSGAGTFQFGATNDKPSEATFNFGASSSSFNFGNSSSQNQNVIQPFQFGHNVSSASAPAPTFQFGAPGSHPPGSGAPVFSIGAGPSTSHRSRPTREARRRR